MHEVLEQGITYARGVWRFRWYAMAIAWVIVLIGWTMVFRMPDQYQANARVYVDTDSILRPLLRGLAVQSNTIQRVHLMTRTLLSRPNLEKVARMTDQDITAKTPEEMEALLDELGSNIKLTSTIKERNLYSLGYQHEDPKVAKQIVQAILTIFVESSLGEARKDSDVAQRFLDKQIEEYEAKLIKAENRRTDFKRQNLGSLPGQGGDVFSRLQAAYAELEQARLVVKETEQRRDELESQIEDAEDSEEDLLLSVDSSITASLDARIQSLQLALDHILLKYTEEHPDVIEIRRTVALLEEQKQDEIKEKSEELASSHASDNPVRQQLQLSLGQINANLAAGRVRIKEFEARAEKIRKLIDTQPQVETELKRLNRDYAVNKKNYDALVARRESASMSEDAEQTGDNVKFRVVDPPRVPILPSGPNRVLYGSGVLVGGIGIGLIVAFLLSQIRPAVYDRRSLQKLTGFPVFGSVSRVWTPELLFKRRLEFGAYILAGTILLFAYSGIFLLSNFSSGS